MILYVPVNIFSHVGAGLLCWTSTKQLIGVLLEDIRSDAGEALTCNPSISSQALYHCATALPNNVNFVTIIVLS